MSSKSEHLGWLVKCLQHRHHRALDKKLASKGLTLVQWNALREIDRNPGCSQRQLAEKTFNSDQALGTLLTRLESAGLIERLPGSGRAVIQKLTAAGEALLHDGQEVMSEVINASFAQLTTVEREEFARLLNKILDTKIEEG